MGFTVHHEMDTDVDTFWNLYFDPEVARIMLAQLGNLGAFEILEDRFDGDGVRHRRIDIRSTISIPKFVHKLVGDGSLTEVGQWSPQLKRYSVEVIPKVNGDRFRTRCEITTMPIGDGSRCRREVLTDNRVELFGMGRAIESVLERAQRDLHERSAQFMNDWLKGLHR